MCDAVPPTAYRLPAADGSPASLLGQKHLAELVVALGGLAAGCCHRGAAPRLRLALLQSGGTGHKAPQRRSGAPSCRRRRLVGAQVNHAAVPGAVPAAAPPAIPATTPAAAIPAPTAAIPAVAAPPAIPAATAPPAVPAAATPSTLLRLLRLLLRGVLLAASRGRGRLGGCYKDVLAAELGPVQPARRLQALVAGKVDVGKALRGRGVMGRVQDQDTVGTCGIPGRQAGRQGGVASRRQALAAAPAMRAAPWAAPSASPCPAPRL